MSRYPSIDELDAIKAAVYGGASDRVPEHDVQVLLVRLRELEVEVGASRDVMRAFGWRLTEQLASYDGQVPHAWFLIGGMNGLWSGSIQLTPEQALTFRKVLK